MQPGERGPNALYKIIGLLDGVSKTPNGYKARCPAHDDRKPSLGVAVGDNGSVILNCRAGCSAENVLAAIGLTLADLYDVGPNGGRLRRFRLLDPSNNVVATHVREDVPGDKIMHWERGGKRSLNGLPLTELPLYGLAGLLAAPKPSTVYVTEGETAADALIERGLIAVGTVTGASACPSAASLEPLRGHDVVLWPDNDDAGREHMQTIAAQLGAVRWLTWPDAPDKGDAADYFAAGGTVERLEKMVGQPVTAAPSQPGLMTAASGTRLDVIRMSEVKPEPITWLWRGRFARGKPTLLMGDPGLGKSLITHTAAAIISRGGEWPDGEQCPQGTAILFTTEDGLADTVAPRLLAAKAIMPNVIAVRGVLDEKSDSVARMFALDEHLAMLEQLIVQEGAIFVAMDPISAYLGPDVNSHKEADVRAVLGPVSMMAERTGIVLVMLMHLNKGTGVSALYRATGSIAFPALARIVLGVAPDPNDETRRLLLPVKMNIGKVQSGIGYRIETSASPDAPPLLNGAGQEDQPPILVWDSEPVTIDATSALDRNGTAQEIGAASEVKDILRELLANGRMQSNECKRLIREAGGSTSETTLSRARRELGVKVRREGFGSSGIWYWEIPQSIDSHSLARTPITETMEPLESMPIGSIDSIGSKDSKGSIDSMDSRARGNGAVQRACLDCGGPAEQHQARCSECHAKRDVLNLPF